VAEKSGEAAKTRKRATASLMRGLVQAASVRATAFGADPEFWLEKQFGHRICAWVDQVLSNDAKAFGDTPELRDELIRCLDFMISAGMMHRDAHHPER
jgi:hypothetical protein